MEQIPNAVSTILILENAAKLILCHNKFILEISYITNHIISCSAIIT